MRSANFCVFCALFIFSHFCSFAQETTAKSIKKTLTVYLNSNDFHSLTGHVPNDSVTLDSIDVNINKQTIGVYIDPKFSYAPVREYTVLNIENTVRECLSNAEKRYSITIYSDGRNIIEFIPNFYRSDSNSLDAERMIENSFKLAPPLVQNISKPDYVEPVLWGLNLALWNSHGWYYEPSLNRWEWQRARLFNTVEDLYPTTYILNFLMPMLENSGAQVFLPRERYWQNNEVIVDNDQSTGESIFTTNSKTTKTNTGFGIGNLPYTNENPFKLGTALEFLNLKKGSKIATYIPDIPQSGMYPVYVSYKASMQNTDAAEYTINHSGGSTTYLVNQQIGGGTWVYLGLFAFEKGVNEATGSITLSIKTSDKNMIVSADAVRFGNGMGLISRNGHVSRRPKYQEAARYFLQYNGFSDSLIWKQNVDNDYADDRHARGSWVNYLMKPIPKTTESEKGLGIPIDLTLAFHTDAGITNNDSVLGTLAIYSTKMDSAYYPSGLVKMASRDLCDIVQSQIVNDLRAKYDSNWVRRDLWDKAYTEAVRPNTPTMMLELLSHQNFMDVRFGKEPTFQFDVSRAVYKGILKFLNSLYGIPYIVQPLPVNNFQTAFNKKNEIELKWQAQTDALEETAVAKQYVVYKKENNGGYDNGTLVETNSYIFKKPKKDVIYSFKVTAVNEGGESFPSEELSVCKAAHSKGTVLIVNAFDRLGGAAYFNDEKTAGFLTQQDAGVPYRYDISTTGDQYDFDKTSPWLDDDSPGFGASYADMEDKIIPGNTFDFSFIHGSAIKKAGYSFISVSDESFESVQFNAADYKVLDFLAGEEKTSYLPKDSTPHYQIFNEAMLLKLKGFVENGGNIFISGAHIATDAQINDQNKEVEELLKYKWRTSNACKTGVFWFNDANFAPNDSIYSFNANYHPEIYTVEGADALEPTDKLAKTLVRYSENNLSAGIIYEGNYKVIAFGFPFETITSETQRDFLMQQILHILNP